MNISILDTFIYCLSNIYIEEILYAQTNEILEL